MPEVSCSSCSSLIGSPDGLMRGWGIGGGDQPCKRAHIKFVQSNPGGETKGLDTTASCLTGALPEGIHVK